MTAEEFYLEHYGYKPTENQVLEIEFAEAYAEQQIKELKGYIENALRIKDLWLIEDKNCPPENVGEARALANMEAEFLKALNQ